MIEQKRVDINGVEYTLNTIVATKALALQPSIMKLIGRSLVAFFEGNDGSAKTTDAIAKLEGEVMKKIVDTLIEDVEKVNIVDLAKNLIACGATKGTMSINFDNEFTGNLGTLYKLLFAIIKMNFLDVFIVSDSVGA
jgi:ABC-type siderophore export system fused ATPase/permease subunit